MRRKPGTQPMEMIPEQNSLIPMPAPIVMEDEKAKALVSLLPSIPQIHDVVCVTNPNSQHFGVMFQIGDIHEGKLHGFLMHTGGRKEFITVGAGEVLIIGATRMRSRQSVSEQWAAERKKA